jgi:hypothetical protein
VNGSVTPQLVRLLGGREAHGVPAVLREYAGATHDSAPSAATADIFTFFDRHPRAVR